MQITVHPYLGTGDLATLESSRFLTDMEGTREMADARLFFGASEGRMSSVTPSCCSPVFFPCSSCSGACSLGPVAASGRLLFRGKGRGRERNQQWLKIANAHLEPPIPSQYQYCCVRVTLLYFAAGGGSIYSFSRPL